MNGSVNETQRKNITRLPSRLLLYIHRNFIFNLRKPQFKVSVFPPRCFSLPDHWFLSITVTMDCVNKVDRSAFVAFSPEAPSMAAGTMAGTVDMSFSSSSNLEIFELDFQSNDRDLTLVGHCSSSEQFNRLAWGSYGSNSNGLIAGGLVKYWFMESKSMIFSYPNWNLLALLKLRYWLWKNIAVFD